MNREFPYLLDGRSKTSEDIVEIRSPYNQDLVGITYRATPADLETAIQAATRAFQQTSRLPTYRRAEILEKAVQAMKADREEMARLIAREAGKPIRSARGEVNRAILTFTDALEESKRLTGE